MKGEMRYVLMTLIASLFLIGFAALINAHVGITGSATNNDSNGRNHSNEDINETAPPKENGHEVNEEFGEKNFGNKHFGEMFNETDRIWFNDMNNSCPPECTCNESSMICPLKNGTREMIIFAGKSGNMIVQVNGENMSTNISLYKADDGKLYGIFGENETREIKMLPDQVKDKIRENSSREYENENITLDENGTYKYHAEKKAKLFGIFSVNVPVDAEVDSETGEISAFKKPWWSFLAKDEETEQLVGASCGTVTPGYNDECCENKGYDFWNETTVQCEFNSSESTTNSSE